MNGNGASGVNHNFSSLEKLILKELLLNPRKSINEISQHTKKTRKTISKRIKMLCENNKIKFSLKFNKNYLKVDYFFVQMQLKKFDDAQYFIDLFKNCPKTIFCLYVSYYNVLLVLLFDEQLESNSSNNHEFFSCIHLIHRIHADPRISDCQIHPHCNLVSPNFINIDRGLELRKYNTAPCGARCENCNNYHQTCVGCPCTIHYAGELVI